MFAQTNKAAKRGAVQNPASLGTAFFVYLFGLFSLAVLGWCLAFFGILILGSSGIGEQKIQWVIYAWIASGVLSLVGATVSLMNRNVRRLRLSIGLSWLVCIGMTVLAAVAWGR